MLSHLEERVESPRIGGRTGIEAEKYDLNKSAANV